MTSESPHTENEGDSPPEVDVTASDEQDPGETEGDGESDLSPDLDEPPVDDGEDETGGESDREPELDGDNEETDEELEEELSPALDSDVYRKPFAAFNSHDIESVADAVEVMDPTAAATIREVYRLNEKLEKQTEHFKEKATEAQQELQEFRRRKNNETEEIKETATKDFIKDALPIRDNLERALDQDNGEIRSGVALIKEDFDELLENEGVTIIEPDPGDEVDPEVHEVMTRVESEHDEGVIDECYRPGYSMEGYVIRPARVTVSGK